MQAPTALLLTALILSSSQGCVVRQSASTATRDPTTQQSERLYRIKCLRCHQHYDPASYGPEEWERWMRLMSKKAGLSQEEEIKIKRYLDSLRDRD